MSTGIEKEKEKLYEEIQAEEEIIAKLPAYIETNDRALLQERATHQRNLAEKLMQLEVIAEEERIASVAREHLEIHPYMLEKECPICLDLVPITHPDSIHFQSCCGAKSREEGITQEMSSLSCGLFQVRPIIIWIVLGFVSCVVY